MISRSASCVFAEENPSAPTRARGAFSFSALGRMFAPHGRYAHAVPGHHVRTWKVLHACNVYGTVGAIIDAQSAVGMWPEVLTPDAGQAPAVADERPAARAGLLRAWKNIRDWRRALLECSAATACEIVHAHCFPAGIAAVRQFPVVVYELEQFLEDSVGSQTPVSSRTPKKLMASSYETAERFVISRAAAIVVRNESVRQELVRRGAAAEHVFVIPSLSVAGDAEGARIIRFPRSDARVDRFSIFSTCDVGANWRAWLSELLAAVRAARQKIPALKLYLEIGDKARLEIVSLIAQFGLERDARLVDGNAAAKMLAKCSLVVAGSTQRTGATPTENPLAVAALRAGKPLLAADLACNRDVTARGAGCIWFRPEDTADMAARIVLLASDATFRSALAASGARYWREMHDPVRIAEQYDAVYRHAYARRRSGKWRTPVISLQPSHACI